MTIRSRIESKVRTPVDGRSHTGGRALLALAIGCALPASAVEYSAEPYVSLRSLYTDNFDLTPTSQRSVWGTIISPGLRANAESETWKVSGAADVRFNRYSKSEINNTEGLFTFGSEYRTERNKLGLNFNYNRDNTLLGELGTTGVVQAYAPRTLVLVNPNFSRELTEKTDVKGSYTFTSVHYSDVGGTPLIGYNEHNATVGLDHKLTERTVASISTFYDLYESDPASFRTRNVGFLLGLARDFSEKLHASMRVGPRWTRSETEAQATVCNAPINFGVCTGTLVTLGSSTTVDSSGFIAGADITNRWETGQVKAGIGRDLNPSGVGALIQTDAIHLQLNQDLSPRWTTQFISGFYKAKYVGAAIDPNKSSYFIIEPRIGWRVAPNWLIEAGYSFARQKYEGQSDDARANTVFVTLSYAWQKLAISR